MPYYVAWRSKDHLLTGNGGYISFADATAWVLEMNAKHPDIHHWVVTV